LQSAMAQKTDVSAFLGRGHEHDRHRREPVAGVKLKRGSLHGPRRRRYYVTGI
jgi:hypothetical protein